MKTDVAGRVKNTILAASKPLLPLYEAVVNSVQAIQDGKEKNGVIDINIVRDDNHLFKEQATEIGEIVGFEVIDNGIGFNDENYHAFETSDTTYKAQRGGKGIGRFLWLVAFDKVEVESHFKDGVKQMHRYFEFVSEGDGIRGMTVSTAKEKKYATKVRLVGFHAKYQQQCPKKIDTIAAHLIEHCLEYFIRSDCPQIMLNDVASGIKLNLNERFEQEMSAKSKPATITVGKNDFYVLHVRLYSSQATEHLVHFCANSRVVKSEKLLGKIPNLAKRLQDESGKDFIYAVYIDGKVFDDLVNAERTDFSISEDGADLLQQAVTMQEIRNAVFESCRKYLEPYTKPIRAKKRKRIEDFIATDGPMYRPILKYVEDKVDLIDPEVNDDVLDLKLYQAYHELLLELKSNGQKLFQEDLGGGNWDEYQKRFQEYFSRVNDVNKSDLARYICHRRAILDYLHKQLSINDDGKYRREERVHQIIFPLGKTSDEVPFDTWNLWLLDEKLVYHTFLASDKPLNTNLQVKVNSRKEPDLIIFNKACAFTANGDVPYSAIAIVEFKRPMRDNYDANENPFVQVRKYVENIRAGTARTPDGRDIPIGKDIPFFCYIVSDITKTLEQHAYDFELTKTFDGQGFFGYKKQYNAYIEVISYTKMITDAKKRNTVFFDKLAIPTGVNIRKVSQEVMVGDKINV
jgi:hypothetical protein